MTFIKSFVNFAFFCAILNTTTILIKIISNRYFNKNFFIDYNTISVGFILLSAFTITLITFGNSKYVTKAVRIDEKSIDVERVMDAMERMKWRLKEKNEEYFTFISPLSAGIIREEIIVRFVETEIHITGSHRYVEDMIRLAKFPYGSFELLATE